jgi:hypothetical protein
VADTVLETASEIGLATEWMQTQKAVERPDQLHLGGCDQKILGRSPRMGPVNAYFVGWLLVHPLVSIALPRPYRSIWQGGTIAFELVVTAHNAASIQCRAQF